jgi:AraC family ethanolamine operon transcriptional activator
MQNPDMIWPQLIEECFSDFDKFAEGVAAWDIDFKQLSSGRLGADLKQVLDPQLTLSTVRFDQRCLQNGASPAGMRTLGLMEANAPDNVFCGHHFHSGSLALISKSGEFESTSLKGFDICTISVAEDWLDKIAELHGYVPPSDCLPSGAAVLPCEKRKLADARAAASVFIDLSRRSRNCLIPVHIMEAAREKLAVSLLSSLGSVRSFKPRPGRMRRYDTLRRAKSYIRAHLAEPVRIAQVAAALSISTRTLEMVFRDLAGTTPNEFIMTSRLYEVRRALRQADSDCQVSEIAGLWGFWHMGEFARVYRSRFGELPSKTLGDMAS